MPLPSDEKLVQTASDLVSQLHTLFGKHDGFRASAFPKIPILHSTDPPPPSPRPRHPPNRHLHPHPPRLHPNHRPALHPPLHPSTPLTLRFSSSTGLPQIPDTDPSAQPRGLALRFHLGPHSHTDIIAHSTPYFPTRTGAEFLDILKALGAPPPPEGSNEPSAAEKFLGANPAAMRFVQAPKPTPSSFTRETYYAVNAFHFINSAGAKTAFRYRIVPTAGESHMPSCALASKSPDFLYVELPSALPATFKLVAQMAGEGDVVDDATVLWGEGREVVVLGEVRVEGVVEGEGERRIIFDPVPRVEGVEGSGDPLLELRAGVYLISGRERREA